MNLGLMAWVVVISGDLLAAVRNPVCAFNYGHIKCSPLKRYREKESRRAANMWFKGSELIDVRVAPDLAWSSCGERQNS